jgi:uncharacterized membrane protein YhaH (DUF805 family)
MNFWQAVRSGFANYVTFQGRAIRSEYWFWVLFTVLGGLVTETLDAGLFSSQIPAASPLNGVFDLITLLPSFALSVRRLHDIDRTGWWVLIAFSIIGVFVLIYWACKKGTPGANRFGGDPFAALGPITQPPTA